MGSLSLKSSKNDKNLSWFLLVKIESLMTLKRSRLRETLSVERGAKLRRGKCKAIHAVAMKRQKRRESSSEL